MVPAYRAWQRMRDKAFSLAVGRSFRAFGANTVVQPPLRVWGEARISIGSEVFVGANSWIAAIDELEGVVSTIDVGDGTSLAGNCVISAAMSVRLGRGVLLARNVFISDHNHAYRDVTRPVLQQGVDKVAPVSIGDGAWLGQNVVVTAGVHIGRGAVVGANSIVKHDVPDYSLAVGAPARMVRSFG